MTKKLSMPDSSILETELARVAENDKINAIRIIETADGFYVVTDIKAREAETSYLATRREPDQPRLFRDLERLNNLLRELYPDGPIELQCQQKYQPKSERLTKKKASSKKKRAKKKSSTRK